MKTQRREGEREGGREGGREGEREGGREEGPKSIRCGAKRASINENASGQGKLPLDVFRSPLTAGTTCFWDEPPVSGRNLAFEHEGSGPEKYVRSSLFRQLHCAPAVGWGMRGNPGLGGRPWSG